MTLEEKNLNEMIVKHVMTGPIPVVGDDDKILYWLRPQSNMGYIKADTPFDAGMDV